MKTIEIKIKSVLKDFVILAIGKTWAEIKYNLILLSMCSLLSLLVVSSIPYLI